MAEVGVEILKNKIDEYVQRARDGETIVVTEKDHPAVVLARPHEDPETHQAWTLVESGAASWSGGKPQPPTDPPKVKGRSTSDIVLEDRR